MSAEERRRRQRQQNQIEECPYVIPRDLPSLPLRKHQYLHPDGRHLITTWFDRAWQLREEEDATFECFIFAWIAVNAWAACITGEDQDRAYMNRITNDAGLREAFEQLLRDDIFFKEEVHVFVALLPIFKAQQLRRQHIHLDEPVSRGERVQHYLRAGSIEFAPDCARVHLDRGEPIPCDWPHFIQAVYRVRCNLFHGEKSAHSEMDHHIVRSALLSLTSFFRGAEIL